MPTITPPTERELRVLLVRAEQDADDPVGALACALARAELARLCATAPPRPPVPSPETLRDSEHWRLLGRSHATGYWTVLAASVHEDHITHLSQSRMDAHVFPELLVLRPKTVTDPTAVDRYRSDGQASFRTGRVGHDFLIERTE